VRKEKNDFLTFQEVCLSNCLIGVKSLNHQCKQAVQKDFYCLADALAAKEELGKTKAKYYIEEKKPVALL